MRKSDGADDHSVVLPLLGSGVLGAGAYGSHKLNKFMESLGIKSNYTLNRDALQAFEDYATLKAGKINPETFAYQYAQAAHRAGASKLFNEDPKASWEWLINNQQMRKGIHNKALGVNKKLDKVIEKLEKNKLTKWLSKPFGFVNSQAGMLKDTFEPLDTKINRAAQRVMSEMAAHGRAMKPEAAKKYVINQLAHVPAMAQSELDSYVRLLSEVAPNVQNAGSVAANTVEALQNYKNPKYTEHIGKVFNSPAEYLAEMYTPKGHKPVPGAFDSYIESVQEAFKKNPTNKNDGLAWEIRGLLNKSKKGRDPFNEGRSLYQELLSTVGSRAQWEQGGDGIRIAKSGKLAPGIRSIQDIRDRALNNPALKFLDGVATTQYSQAAKPYNKMTRALKWLMTARNKKLRIGLGIGSAGLGVLGITNLIRNIRNKKDMD